MKQDTPSLSSLFAKSQYQMADITKKAATFRRAMAMGRITVGKTGFTHIKEQTLPKGDVLKLAEIAGVQGAKLAWQHIPMCHPLLLDHVVVYPELEEKTHSVAVYAQVATTAKTGVEMEALAAVNAALLTLYDLTKPVEPALSISDVRLLFKEGGKKGLWVHPDGVPLSLEGVIPAQSAPLLSGRSAALITMSDRAAQGVYEDRSGALLKSSLEEMACEIIDACILPDDADQLRDKITQMCDRVDLIITTGGTGLAARDITPQILAKMADYEVPGLGELLRGSAADHVPTTWLSRSSAVVINQTLVIALPGSTGGVKDGVAALKPILAHALDHLANRKDIHPHPDEGKEQ